MQLNQQLVSSNPPSADLLGVHYMTLPLCELPEAEAVELIHNLFSEEERFFKGFFLYWHEVLNQPYEEALESTRKEVQGYIDTLTTNLSDPRYFTLGHVEEGIYKPVGLFGFRLLEEHPIGPELLKTIEHEPDLKSQYQGRLAVAHAMSMLDGHRHRKMLAYSFALIGLKAIEMEMQHIFFFASDHRLKRIYSRFGLEFPANLKLPNTKHMVGSYSLTPQNIEAVYETARRVTEENVTQGA
jgi:hypothetical protein